MEKNLQATLSHLRDDFIARLPGRIAFLESLLEAVIRGELEAIASLHREARSLAGIAGTHRLMQVFEAARKLESIVAAVSAGKETTDAELQNMREAMVNLASQAEQPTHSLVPASASRHASQRIVIVDDDVEQANWLCSVLEQAGYQVEVFNNLHAFRDACQKQTVMPAAVIMDMIFPEGAEAGAHMVAEMKAKCLGALPVIFYSVRDDIAAKLIAYRAGATRYLTKPAGREMLLQVINESAALRPAEPFRVLMVDDDPDQLAVHALLLRQTGIEVQETNDPLTVPKMLDHFAADLLLLDMYMPQCSGPELAAILRDDARHAGIPVVYLSAETDISRQLLALDRAGDHFLTKPVEPGHLIAVVTMHAKRFRQNAEQSEMLRSTLYERERQQQALDAHAIVSASDVAGNIIYVNDKFCEASGYSREELLLSNHRILKSGIHPPGVYNDMWRTIKSGQIWRGEICNRRKDGSLYWVATSIVPFLGVDGRPYQYISIRTDISQLKQHEGALRSNEAQLRMALDNAADAVFVAGQDERWAYVNDRAVSMLGYSREELLTMSIYDLVPADWRETYRNNFRRKLLADGVMHQEIRLINKAGRKIAIEMNAAVLPDGRVYGSCRDISLRKEAEAAIKNAAARIHESEQRLNQAQNIAHLGSFEWSVISGELTWSDEHYRLWGLEPGSVTPSVELFRQPIAPDDLVKLDDALQRAMTAREVFDSVYRLTRPDGSERVMHSCGEFTFDEAGNALNLVGTVQDITEQKQSEAALQKTQQLMNSIVEFMPAMVFIKRADDLRFELFNRAGESLLGYSRNDLLGKNDYDFFPKEQADFFIAQDRKVLASQEFIDIPQEPIRTARGDTRYLNTKKVALRNASGKPTHLLGVSLDITERIQAQQALNESRARLEAAQTQAHLGNWEADIITGKLYWSDEIFRIFGHDPAHFTPSVEAFTSAVHPDDVAKVRESESRATQTGIHDVVHRILRPDGEVRYVHELARSQLNEEGKLVRLTGTVQDVTDLKRAEQELIKAKDAAESASRAKSEFLASMSHELRTPLNAILGFAQLFAMDAKLPAETRINAQEIDRAGQHLLSLVNDLIDLARIESGKLELALEPVPVKAVIRDSMAMAATQAKNHNIHIEEVDCGSAEITVWADYVRLRQVMINLLSNAIKYNRPHGTVRLSCHIEEGSIRIRVSDTGQGIPVDKQTRIFNSFDRLGMERGTVEGTGIGLVITKRIVDAMGGRIGFESVAGQGSTFWVTFPLTMATKAPESHQLASDGKPAETFVGLGAPTNRPVVLYIEDNPMNMRLMQQIFAGRKHLELCNAHTAELGLELAFAISPALILMDINLPGMDGYKALPILKADARTAHVPVIAISANAMVGDKERGLQAGFTDYLTKPLNVQRLLSLLDEMLNTKAG